MRAVIVDWILDIHTRLRLSSHSLYLAVLILDRFTAKVSLDRPALQLLALAALLVASKHEDVTSPSLKTMLRFTESFPGGCPPKAQLLAMEKRVLEVMGFSFLRPTLPDFLDKFLPLLLAPSSLLPSTSSSTSSFASSLPSSSSLTACRARYFAERILFDPEMTRRYAPSRLAAGALYLAARHELPEGSCWTPFMEAETGYSHEEARQVARMIGGRVREALPLVGTRRLTALTRKYASTKWREVSSLSCLDG